MKIEDALTVLIEHANGDTGGSARADIFSLPSGRNANSLFMKFFYVTFYGSNIGIQDLCEILPGQ
ncbi:MAG: hypothetical protein ABIJ59_08215 [Pseudomonadota bacterium]